MRVKSIGDTGARPPRRIAPPSQHHRAFWRQPRIFSRQHRTYAPFPRTIIAPSRTTIDASRTAKIPPPPAPHAHFACSLRASCPPKNGVMIFDVPTAKTVARRREARANPPPRPIAGYCGPRKVGDRSGFISAFIIPPRERGVSYSPCRLIRFCLFNFI